MTFVSITIGQKLCSTVFKFCQKSIRDLHQDNIDRIFYNFLEGQNQSY